MKLDAAVGEFAMAPEVCPLQFELARDQSEMRDGTKSIIRRLLDNSSTLGRGRVKTQEWWLV